MAMPVKPPTVPEQPLSLAISLLVISWQYMAPVRNTQPVYLMPPREHCVAPRSPATIPTPTAEQLARSNKLWKTNLTFNTL